MGCRKEGHVPHYVTSSATAKIRTKTLRSVFDGLYRSYRIYSINRPGRLLNFWTLRVGAYSRWALIRGGRLFEAGRLLNFTIFSKWSNSRRSVSTKFYMGRLRPEFQPLNPFMYHFWQTRYPFLYFPLTNVASFNIPHLELFYIPFFPAINVLF